MEGEAGEEYKWVDQGNHGYGFTGGEEGMKEGMKEEDLVDFKWVKKNTEADEEIKDFITKHLEFHHKKFKKVAMYSPVGWLLPHSSYYHTLLEKSNYRK